MRARAVESMGGTGGDLIRYWIPGDGDDPEHPNCFRVPARRGGALCLSDVVAAFPLPGRYHFRFRVEFGNTKVWRDLVADADAVPACEGVIFAKVTRLAAADAAAAPRAAPNLSLIHISEPTRPY